MAKAEAARSTSMESLNIDFMRSLVKQYSELGQWSSALFWADAAAGAGSADGVASGDDIWLLACAMLARGELHRAAYAVTSRRLHQRHLLCLGVAMRAYVAAKEPEAALALMEECDPTLLEPKNTDQTHNRALAGVLVCRARALSSGERREAAAEALRAALKADVACAEALDLLMHHHALSYTQECELLDSLPISSQLGAAEGALVRAAYRQRLLRYAPPDREPAPQPDCPMVSEVERCRGRTMEAGMSMARRLAAGGQYAAALRQLDRIDPWCCAELRVACLVELKKTTQLFTFAHTLVDAYPQSWQAWYAVGCYYYLIGKNEFARRYLSKAKSLEPPGAGCIWLAYGHCFVPDSEHDQAMAAYFKASQVMCGSALPALYVGVECSLLNNLAMSERFFARAAHLYAQPQSSDDSEVATPGGGGMGEGDADVLRGQWHSLAHMVKEPLVAHEAGAAAFRAADYKASMALFKRALALAPKVNHEQDVGREWAATVDGVGHACRKAGLVAEAVWWHRRALCLRPGHAPTLAALGLCLALQGLEQEAADALHSALAKDPDDVVSLALLDAIVDRLDAALSEEEVPQFPFPAVNITPAPAPAPAPPTAPATPAQDATIMSDMSMSFD